MNNLLLQHLKSGQTANITQILGNSGETQRLREIGIMEGSVIKMLQSCGGRGSSCIFLINNNRVCLRTGDSFKIEVEYHSGLTQERFYD